MKILLIVAGVLFLLLAFALFVAAIVAFVMGRRRGANAATAAPAPPPRFAPAVPAPPASPADPRQTVPAVPVVPAEGAYGSPLTPLDDDWTVLTDPRREQFFGALHGTSGALSGRAFPIDANGFYVGRDRSASQVVIDSPSISKRHVWIGVRDGVVMAIDQSSTNRSSTTPTPPSPRRLSLLVTRSFSAATWHASNTVHDAHTMTTKSKSPWILAGCGCMSLIAALIFLVAAFLWTENRTPVLETKELQDDRVVYHNTREGRTGALAEHWVGFEFRYPKTWVLKPDSDASNFVSVERAVKGQTYENFNVGYFATAGSKEGNQALYSQLIAQFQSQFEKQFQDLKKVSEGATKVGSYDGWEGLFTSTTGEGDTPVQIYTRVILLPTPDGTKGVSLLMMGTSLSPDLQSADDLGHKGELPAVLESFKFAD